MEDQNRFKVDTSVPGLDISNELMRTYYFGNGSHFTVHEPESLWVKVQGNGLHSHRIATKRGTGVYIPSGWIGLEWTLKDPTASPVSF